MINKLIIQNYQSHKDSVLEFSPGLNIIIGSSDSGKTAIVRALRWIKDNRPTGDTFRSTWGGKTLVRVELEDGNIIERIKDKTINRYVLNNIKFDAIKTEVPDEIVKVLNLSEINAQTQFDSPFLLSNSAGEVAQHFNRIANIDKIDSSVKIIQKWIRSIEGDIKAATEEMQRLESDLEEFADLDVIELKVEEIEKLEKSVEEKGKTVSSIQSIIDEIENIEIKIKERQIIQKSEFKVNELLHLFNYLDDKTKDLDRLAKLLKAIRYVEHGIDESKRIIKAKGVVDDLLSKYDLLEEKQDIIYSLSLLIEKIMTNKQKVKKLKIERIKLQEKFNELMPDICPLCEQEIK